MLHGLRPTVAFTSQNNASLPDPAIHTACAKVAHLSGARQYIDSVDRDIDTTPVIGNDGSSGGVLTGN